MDIKDLMEVVHKAYPDEQTRCYWSEKKLKPIRNRYGGDTLAEFIVRELFETFDPAVSDAEQLGEAIRVMEVATREIDNVRKALENVEFDTFSKEEEASGTPEP